MLAGAIRLSGLAAPDGRLRKDEAKQAFAATSVLQHGVPLMPSGRIFTRGLLNTYLTVPAIALLGPHDFAALLPSVVAGALMVPVMFLFGRAAGGTPAGLAAAVFTVFADPFVFWSRSALHPSIFLLMFTLSSYYWYRGLVERRGGWQVAGAVGFCLAVLSYEFAVLLPLGLALYVAVRAIGGRWDWYRGPATVLAGALTVGGVLLWGGLALALSAGTLAGPLGGDIRAYTSPGLSLNGVAFYLGTLLSNYWVLIAAALLGLPLLARARPRTAIYLGALLAVTFLVPSFFIQSKYNARYALPVLPVLAVLAASSTVQLARLLARFDRTGRMRRFLPALALLAVFGLALSNDVGETGRRFQQSPPGTTWVQALQELGVQPTDMIVTDAGEMALFYFGRADFYFRPGEFQRYTYRAPDAVRNIHTNSVMLRKHGDFERLVEQPNPGRTIWVVGRVDVIPDLVNRVDPQLMPSLRRSAERTVETRDGWLLLEVTLPRQAGRSHSAGRTEDSKPTRSNRAGQHVAAATDHPGA